MKKEHPKLSCWARATAENALTTAGLKGENFDSKTAKLLDFYEISSAPYDLICQSHKTVAKHRRYATQFNRDFFGSEARVAAVLTVKAQEGGEIPEDTLWMVFQELMLKSLPLEVESNEERLRKCVKEKQETMDAYLQRFQGVFRKYPTDQKTGARILFHNMPNEVKVPLQAMPVNADVEMVIHNIKNITYWG